jgi:hypothetical protein
MRLIFITVSITDYNEYGVFNRTPVLREIIIQRLWRHKKHPLIIINPGPFSSRNLPINLSNLILINPLAIARETVLLLIDKRPCWRQKVYLPSRKPPIVVQDDHRGDVGLTETRGQTHQGVVQQARPADRELV